MADIAHSLVLNLHQPPGNLEELLAHNEWEAREILLAMDRIPRSLWGYEDVARVHLALSGTLLETLSSPDFQSRVGSTIDCSSLLWYFPNTSLFHLLGTAYYHPVLPLIPAADWEEQLRRWQGIGRHLFNRNDFPGFWPPAMGFCMELIPTLKRFGYRYVLVDCEYVEPVTPMRWEEVRYRPHIARFGDEEIIVIVRDRELSNAQESGMDTKWFMQELYARTKGCDFPPLVTTCTDGENGGWFRNMTEGSNFWTVFYRPLLEQVRAGTCAVRPGFINEYLQRHGAHGIVKVRPGAWNTGWHQGTGFVQWTESQAQRDALSRLDEVSQAVQAALADAQSRHPYDSELHHQLEEAHWRVLRAETSCNFFWGETWVDRCHRDLDEACACLERTAFK